jgi:hypothetical protein
VINDDDLSSRYKAQLRDAVEDAASREADWDGFHSRLGRAVAPALAALRLGTRGGRFATTQPGAAWWNYAARFGLAAVPLALAAALLLFTYLRSNGGGADDQRTDVPAIAIADGGADSARAAFESVLTGTSAPRAAMASLIPIPATAYLADAGGIAR